ncbi:MAG TPA: YncE family protein, partial [Rhodospirillales bacterium]|nr:YncE family protein [Rhodospirillales bacterium]
MIMKTAITFLFAAMIGAAAPALAGTLVYVPMGGANEVLVIDADQDKIIGKISGVENAHGLAGTPDGSLLIAGSLTESDAGSGALPAKPKVVTEDAHQGHHSGQAAKADSGDKPLSYLTVIRTSDRSVIRRVGVPGAVHHVAVTPDGRYAIAIHHTGGGASIIDLKTFESAAFIPTGPSPNYAVAGVDGKFVYVSNSGNNTVSEIDAKTWTVRRNIKTGASPEHMALSIDGGSLYVNNADAGTVSAISLKREGAVKTYPVGGGLHGVDLSDDGK